MILSPAAMAEHASASSSQSLIGFLSMAVMTSPTLRPALPAGPSAVDARSPWRRSPASSPPMPSQTGGVPMPIFSQSMMAKTVVGVLAVVVEADAAQVARSGSPLVSFLKVLPPSVVL